MTIHEVIRDSELRAVIDFKYDISGDDLTLAVTEGLRSLHAHISIGAQIRLDELIKTNDLIRQALAVVGAKLGDVFYNPAKDKRFGNTRGGLAGWQLRAVNTMIRDHLDTSLSVADMAAVTQLSQSHLSRAFRASCGIPPKKYLVTARIKAAESMLLRNGISISEVALNCGFCDQAHFSRVFHVATGLPPGRWQRENRLALSVRSL